MLNIQPISVGLPLKEATKLSVVVYSFDTSQTSTFLSYNILSEEHEVLATGNLELTEEQFSHINDSTYLEDLVINYLGIERINS